MLVFAAPTDGHEQRPCPLANWEVWDGVLGGVLSSRVGEGRDLGTAGGGESAVNDVKFDKCEREPNVRLRLAYGDRSGVQRGPVPSGV